MIEPGGMCQTECYQFNWTIVCFGTNPSGVIHDVHSIHSAIGWLIHSVLFEQTLKIDFDCTFDSSCWLIGDVVTT